jgi:phosphoheptose isomerase
VVARNNMYSWREELECIALTGTSNDQFASYMRVSYTVPSLHVFLMVSDIHIVLIMS